jgi:ATP-dependent Clp endopeptidase proteolytic subunit ClpP
MNKFYEFKNKTNEIFIYDAIDSFSAKDFITQFNNMKGDTLTLHINSPGGAVFEGMAIYNVIRNSDKIVNVIIDGLCASIASVIACAGDSISINANALVMIHYASSFAGGNAKELKKTAEILSKIDDQLVNIYAERTGLDKSSIKDFLDIETWFTAEEAKENNFVDKILPAAKIAAIANLSDYDFQNEKFLTLKNNMSKPNPKSNQRGVKKMDEILKALGVKTEEEALQKISNMKTNIADLQAKDEKVKEVMNKQKVDLAIAHGKILPAKKDFALSLLNADENLYSAFLKNEKVEVPKGNLETPINPPNSGTVKVENFSQLLDNPELCNKIATENPELYKSLYENFYKGE